MGVAADLERADRDAARAVASWRNSRPFRIIAKASEVADQPPLVAISAAVCLLGLASRDRRLAKTGAAMLAAELVATALKGAIKHRVDRTRPEVEHRGDGYRAEAGSSHDTDLNSFPSGHTAGAVAVARTVGRGYPSAAGPTLGLAVAIAAVQVPRGKHYPADLAAGGAIGLVADALVAGAARGIARLLR